jgi:hypothetical protein
MSGLTNPQIAQGLSRSPKTVAAQLNSAMPSSAVFLHWNGVSWKTVAVPGPQE